MVMEKALPHLPEELVKNIEELAGIYRQPGYKELSESLKFLSSSNAIVLLDRETFVPKPRGRPRKGKVWHPKKGCWVDNGLLVFRVGPRNPAHGVSRKVLIGAIFHLPRARMWMRMYPDYHWFLILGYRKYLYE
jgi:hypothetical protein